MTGATTISRSAALVWAGAALTVAAASVRMLAFFDEYPYWRLDPSHIRSEMSGIGPAVSMMCVAATVLGLALVLAGRALAGRRVWIPGFAALGVVAAMVVYHGWAGPGGTLSDRFIGLTWLGALAGGVALFEAGRDRAVRAMALSVLIGVGVVVAGKGMVQLTFEHAATLEYYRENKASVIAANGWTEDSPSVRSYERRLREPVPTGWFGMPNVFGTVVAGAGIACVAIGARGLRRGPGRAASIALGSVGVVLTFMAMLSGSKGVWAAVALGLGVLAAFMLVPALRRAALTRPRTLTRALLGVAVLGPVLAVVLRGQVGEALGELSLWFRWFYWQAAAHVLASHPLGVGPNGFQAAYSLAKSTMSPEDVRSTHNVFLDYFATLGVPGGVATAVLLLRWGLGGAANVTASGASGTDREDEALVAADAGRAMRVGALVAALTTVAATWLDRGAITPDVAIVRVLGMAVWIGVVALVVRLPGRDRRLDLAGGVALVLVLAHVQIDVAAVWLSSAAWVLAWLALAGAPADEAPSLPATAIPGADPAPIDRAGMVAAAVAGCGVAALAVSVVAPTMRWEDRLHRAAERLWIVADLQGALRMVRPETPPEQAWPILQQVVDRLSGLLGRPVAAEPTAVSQAMDQVERMALTQGVDDLQTLPESYARDWMTRQPVCRMLAVLASDTSVRTDPARQRTLFDEALTLARLDSGTGRDNAPRRVFIAMLLQTRHLALKDPADLRAAADELAQAATLAPGTSDLARRAADAFWDAGDKPSAGRWARRALELERLGRLDPVAQGFTEEQHRRLERLAAEP